MFILLLQAIALKSGGFCSIKPFAKSPFLRLFLSSQCAVLQNRPYGAKLMYVLCSRPTNHSSRRNEGKLSVVSCGWKRQLITARDKKRRECLGTKGKDAVLWERTGRAGEDGACGKLIASNRQTSLATFNLRSAQEVAL